MSTLKQKSAIFHHTVEDGLLLDYFCSTQNGTYIDVGGNLPENSVSKQFHEKKWAGFIVEPIPKNVQAFYDVGRNNVQQFAVTSPEKAEAKTATFFIAGGDAGPHSSLDKSAIDPKSLSEQQITVSLTTLAELCNAQNITSADLLSIDTEGTEVDVLKGFDFQKVSVRLILVEDWMRDASIHKYLVARGYKIVRRTGFNSWYVQNNEVFPVPLFGKLKLYKKIYISSYLKRLKHWLDLRKS